MLLSLCDQRDEQSVWNDSSKADEELVLSVWGAGSLTLSLSCPGSSRCVEEMPLPYLKHTSSESLCDTMHRPKLGYPHFGDVLVLISCYRP